MKLKTNKLLTLTLATGLVAMTAGCGGSKTPTASGGNTGGGGGGGGTADTVAYSDWSGSVTTADDVTDNAFLAGVAATGSGATAVAATLTGLPSDATNTTAGTLNLASQVTGITQTATVSGVTTKGVSAVNLGGDATNGVAFAMTGVATEERFVAGVVAGTDLGAPLTTTTASGTWAGLFEAVGDAAHTTRKAFTLTVTFGSTAGNTITALVAANDNANAYAVDGDTSYYISGTYNANGVITGSVLYADFATGNTETNVLANAGTAFGTATDADATGAATNGVGTLSGLIGVDGVLGVFYSSGEDGDGALGFAGGFVASKDANIGGIDPDAVYADWSGSDDVTLVTTLEDNGFLASVTADADGLDVPTQTPAITPAFTTLNLNSPTHAQVDAQPGVAGVGPRTLGGAATSGVAFFSNPGAAAATDARYFAGLHFGTDLGAPITLTTGSAEWNGLIQTISGTPAAQFDAKIFRLSVNYVDSEISAHVTTDTADTNFGIASYYLTGEYDDAGVVTGTVSYSIIANTPEGRTASTANGTLSGLISATSAVGAFHSTADGAAGYAGGFVARSTAIAAGAVIPAGEVVNYADLGVTPVNVLTANGFLAGTATGLTFIQPDPALVPVTVSLATGTEGGATFLETADGVGAFYLAGIHSDTNLGAPVTASTVTGAWSGTFGAVGDATHTTTGTTFTLAVTFGTTDGNTITALVPANDNTNAHGTDTDTSYYISGTYTAAGVISGNVLYRDFATGNANDGAARTAAALALTTATGGSATDPQTVGLGTLTGLIGASGAVGAFHSSGSDSTGASGYAGGFAVTRTPPASP